MGVSGRDCLSPPPIFFKFPPNGTGPPQELGPTGLFDIPIPVLRVLNRHYTYGPIVPLSPESHSLLATDKIRWCTHRQCEVLVLGFGDIGI